MPQIRAMPPAVYLIALGSFALGMASYAMAGLLPMIADDFSVSVAIAAQLVTAFTLAYGLGSPLCIALLSAQHQRAGLLLALTLFTLANLISAWVNHFGVLIISRAAAGVGAGVYLALGIAASATLSAPEQRGQTIALIMAGMASGTVLGVPVSLLLAKQSGWQAALWLVTLLSTLSLLGLLYKLPSLPAIPAVPLRSRLSLLTHRQSRVILSISLLAAISSLGMYTFIAPLITSLTTEPIPSITPYLWIWGMGGITGSFIIAFLVDRIRNAILTLAIMLTLALTMFALPLSAAIHPWLLALPIAIWGAVGWALQVPQNNALIAARLQQGDSHLAVALNESALYLGSAIGAVAGGLVWSLQFPAWAFAVSAGMIALLGALLQISHLRHRRQEQ